MTLMEVVVVILVIFVLMVLAVMLLPRLHAQKHNAPEINCASNLKQITLAYRLWEGDNGDKYPMSVSVTNGGTMELANGRNAWINFLAISNQLTTPKILHCPADTKHFVTNLWSGFNNQNLSYFVNLNANESDPEIWLSGDAHFEIGSVPVKSGLLEISSNTPIAWSAARHRLHGNIGFTDGSVQSTTTSSLSNLLHQTGLATNRLAIP